MPFKKMEKPNVPPRHWVLVGYPGSGKSTFATQMRTPLLPVDADHRFQEVVHLAQGDVYELSDNPADSVDPETIYRLLSQNMPGSGVATIVVDSLTTIITPKVVQAVMDNDAGRNRNRMAAFKDKALSMRLLQDAVTRWGTDVLWIYHLQDSRDEQAREVTRATLSATERARLYRSINLELHLVSDPSTGSGHSSGRGHNRRGIKVVWARRGRSGMTLWDESGTWAGMPEKIEQAVYGGLSVDEQDRIEQETPAVFATEEAAIEWGQVQGVFKDLYHAKNAFNKLKKAHASLSLANLSVLWVEEVERRASEGEQGSKAQEVEAEENIRSDNGPLEEQSASPVTEISISSTGADLEENFARFCEQVTAQLPFYQDEGEVATTLEGLEVTYDPAQEEHLLELLRVHVESLPTFETLKALLARLHQDFGLEEAEAKDKLKALGFSGFPRTGAQEKSRQMYAAVKLALTNPAAEVSF